MDDVEPAAVPIGGVPGVDRAAFEDFLLYEAWLLDARRFRDWIRLFAEDGTYWVPAVHGQRSPLDQASLFYDDRTLMETRVARLEHPKIHIQTPPSHTVHHLGRPLIEAAFPETGEYVVTSTLIMVESRADDQRVFAGRQTHRLRRAGDSFLIIQKRVDLVNCTAPFEAMAVPI